MRKELEEPRQKDGDTGNAKAIRQDLAYVERSLEWHKAHLNWTEKQRMVMETRHATSVEEGNAIDSDPAPKVAPRTSTCNRPSRRRPTVLGDIRISKARPKKQTILGRKLEAPKPSQPYRIRMPARRATLHIHRTVEIHSLDVPRDGPTPPSSSAQGVQGETCHRCQRKIMIRDVRPWHQACPVPKIEHDRWDGRPHSGHSQRLQVSGHDPDGD